MFLRLSHLCDSGLGAASCGGVAAGFYGHRRCLQPQRQCRRPAGPRRPGNQWVDNRLPVHAHARARAAEASTQRVSCVRETFFWLDIGATRAVIASVVAVLKLRLKLEVSFNGIETWGVWLPYA